MNIAVFSPFWRQNAEICTNNYKNMRYNCIFMQLYAKTAPCWRGERVMCNVFVRLTFIANSLFMSGLLDCFAGSQWRLLSVSFQILLVFNQCFANWRKLFFYASLHYSKIFVFLVWANCVAGVCLQKSVESDVYLTLFGDSASAVQTLLTQ